MANQELVKILQNVKAKGFLLKKLHVPLNFYVYSIIATTKFYMLSDK